MAHVGDCECTVYRNVDHGIYVRRQERDPDHYYEMCESVQLLLRILELEEDCEEGAGRERMIQLCGRRRREFRKRNALFYIRFPEDQRQCIDKEPRRNRGIYGKQCIKI